MSFILDALKKLERQREQENKAKDEGRPVMEGGRRWGEGRRSLIYSLGGIGVVALAALVLALLALVQIIPTEQSGPPPSLPETSPGDSPTPEVAPLSAADADESKSETPSATPPGTATPGSGDLREELEEAEASANVGLDADEETPSAADDELETVSPVRLRGRGATQEPQSEAEPTELPEDFPKLVLHGTSVVDGKPVAVINYQRLFVGDTIEGARVISITDRAVELELNGRRFTIRL